MAHEPPCGGATALRENTQEHAELQLASIVIGGVGVSPPSCIAGIICIENLPRGHVDKNISGVLKFKGEVNSLRRERGGNKGPHRPK